MLNFLVKRGLKKFLLSVESGAFVDVNQRVSMVSSRTSRSSILDLFEERRLARIFFSGMTKAFQFSLR